jgi:hypothetical protein
MIEIDVAGLYSSQPTNTQSDQTMTISNTGDADLIWSIDELPAPATESTNSGQSITVDTNWGLVEIELQGGCIPPPDGDIPWVSTNPTAGTISPGTADDVTVTFDSTGISLGVLRANLCINNNSQSGNVQLPVVLELPPAPSIVLTKTVGTDPNTCATTDTINIPAGTGGTQVTYCYTIENTGNITLSLQNLFDDQLGVLLGPDEPSDVAPDASDFYTVSTLITQTTVNTATWEAANTSGLFNDPVGDTFGMGAVQLDITEFNATTEAGFLTLEMAFDGSISPPGTGSPNSIVGILEIDRDGSSLTGNPAFVNTFCPGQNDIGTEYFIDLNTYNPGPGTVQLYFVDEFNQVLVPVGSVNSSFTSSGFTIVTSLSLMEHYAPEEGIVNVAAVVGTTAEPTDCAPDGDTVTSRVDVAAGDSAAVVQNNPTDVNLSSLEGSSSAVWLPIWLILLTIVALLLPAVFLRFLMARSSR